MDTSDGAMNANALQPLRDFMSSISGQLPSRSTVGLVTYGSNAEATMQWKSANEAANTLQNVNLRRMSATNTHLGLNMARREFFEKNDASNPNMVILVSEGPRAGGKLSDYQTACTNLKNLGVRVMVVGKC